MFTRSLGVFFVIPILVVVADVVTIRNVLETMNEGLRRVDLATIGLQNGTASTLRTLVAGAVPLLYNATAVIEASAPLNFEESQSLVIATQALRFNLNVSINDFVAQKPLLAAANQSETLLTALGVQKEAALRMSSALLSKLDPTATQAQASLEQVSEVFTRGVEQLRSPDPPNPPVSLSAPFDPTADLGPVFILLPQPPVSAMGTIGADGSCECAAVCPAGSFMEAVAPQEHR